MSDRIAVMNQGKVVQLGTPAEIYENPRTAFVARFIGESNFFEGRARRSQSGEWEVVLEEEGQSIRIPPHPAVQTGGLVRIVVRPEAMQLYHTAEAPAGVNALRGSIHAILYVGPALHVVVSVPGVRNITVALRNQGQLARPLHWKNGDPVAIAWDRRDCQILVEEE
jgi:spermidine/putrescine transport system ATP-binding protein